MSDLNKVPTLDDPFMVAVPEWGQDIENRLETKFIGRSVVACEEVGSTNDELKILAEQDAPEGLALIARLQKSGRGRRGKSWISTAGKGLYLSVLCRPSWLASESGWLSIVAALSVVQYLNVKKVKGLSIKWPNDVLVNGKKIAGVLIEPRIGEKKIDFIVAGIGMNLLQTAEDWKGSEIEGMATSCLLEGLEIDMEEAATGVLQFMDQLYGVALTPQREELLHVWNKWGGRMEVPGL